MITFSVKFVYQSEFNRASPGDLTEMKIKLTLSIMLTVSISYRIPKIQQQRQQKKRNLYTWQRIFFGWMLLLLYFFYFILYFVCLLHIIRYVLYGGRSLFFFLKRVNFTRFKMNHNLCEHKVNMQAGH